MPGPHPAVALTRRAVRQTLGGMTSEPALAQMTHPRRIVVGVSGGADSLALAAALAFEGPRHGVETVPVIVDHGLQAGSAEIANRAAGQCRDVLGLDPVLERVSVGSSGAGPEADARAARLGVLRQVAARMGAVHVFLGHTGDDQAEQVILGLVRGSGLRSLAGIRVFSDDLVRPFLENLAGNAATTVMRRDTQDACAALGLDPWQDPHNDDPRFARVRVRHLLASLEHDLPAPTLRRSLIRTAESAARDADFLDSVADAQVAALAGSAQGRPWPRTWSVKALLDLDPAIRVRVIQRLLRRAGSPGSDLTSTHLYEVEKLLIAWRGQGPLDLPGHVKVSRSGGEVAIWAGQGENE